MKRILLILLALIIGISTTVGYSQVTDDSEIQYVKDQCDDMKLDITSLFLMNWRCSDYIYVETVSKETVYRGDSITGTNYRVALNVCGEDHTIQYFIATQAFGQPATDPIDLVSADDTGYFAKTTTTQGPNTDWIKVTDDSEIQYVTDQCDDMKLDITTLFWMHQECSNYIVIDTIYKQDEYRSDNIIGRNYRIEMYVCGEYHIIQYFVATQAFGQPATEPSDLKSADKTGYFAMEATTTTSVLSVGGYTQVDSDDLSSVQDLCDGIANDIRGLNGASSSCAITVTDAYYQVQEREGLYVTGTNYRVTISICYVNENIQFFVAVYSGYGYYGSGQMPQGLQLLSDSNSAAFAFDSGESSGSSKSKAVKIAVVSVLVTAVILIACFAVCLFCMHLRKKKQGKSDRYVVMTNDADATL